MGVYKRGDNWYIDFTFKGKRIRESIGPSRKDAEKIIAKKKTEVVENKYLDIRKDPDPIKFHDFAVQYLDWAKTNKKPLSLKNDISRMRFLDKEFERKDLTMIAPWDIEKYKSRRSGEVGAG